jgi:hypothetical protein
MNYLVVALIPSNVSEQLCRKLILSLEIRCISPIAIQIILMLRTTESNFSLPFVRISSGMPISVRKLKPLDM